jgi:hypothetical protein
MSVCVCVGGLHQWSRSLELTPTRPLHGLNVAPHGPHSSALARWGGPQRAPATAPAPTTHLPPRPAPPPQPPPGLLGVDPTLLTVNIGAVIAITGFLALTSVGALYLRLRLVRGGWAS